MGGDLLDTFHHSQEMSSGIVYSCVADSSGVIVSQSNNPLIDNVAEVLIQSSIDLLIDHKKSFSGHPKTKGHTIQYIVDDEICYLSAAAADFPQRICFAFLDDIKREYASNYQGQNKNQAFQQYLAERMDYFSNNPEADKLSSLKVRVTEITDIMHGNVERLLQRGEAIEGIETRAEDLRVKTADFDRQAKRLRCKMCRENAKMCVCLTLIILFVILLVAGGIGALIYIIFFSGLVL